MPLRGSRALRLGTVPATLASMICFVLAHAFSLLLDLMWLGHRAEHDKDVEILLLRQQLRILSANSPSRPAFVKSGEKVGRDPG